MREYKDKVSIIIPIYNCEDFIEKTLLSIKNQTYTNYQVLMIDDLSKDNSLAIIEEVTGNDSRFKLIRLKENSGAAVARNKGIKEATGKYIAFLDSDDIWHKYKLQKQITFMEDNKFDFTFTAYNKIDEDTNKNVGFVRAYEKLNYKDMLKANFIGCSTAIYNQESLGKVYMPLIRKRQDYGLWLALLKKTSYAYGIEEKLTDYLVRSNSVSSNKVNLLKYNWRLFKDIQEFSFLRSTYCLLRNIFYKIFIKR